MIFCEVYISGILKISKISEIPKMKTRSRIPANKDDYEPIIISVRKTKPGHAVYVSSSQDEQIITLKMTKSEVTPIK